MKKLVTSILLLLSISSLVYYDYYAKSGLRSHSFAEKNTIRYVQPPSDEYSAAQSMGATIAFIYEIHSMDASLKQMEYWVEHYIDGARKEDILHSTGVVSGGQDVKLALGITDVNDVLEMWTLSSRYSGSVMSVKAVRPKEAMGTGMSASVLESDKIVKDQTLNLGVSVRNKGNQNSMVYNGSMEETIQHNDEVFLLKCRFF